MQNLPIVHMLHSKADLGEPVKNLRFRKVSTFLIFNLGSKVSTIGKVHHNTQVPLLSLIRFSKSNNIRMIEDLQNLSFFQSLHPFFLAHSRDNDLFDDR